MTKHKQLSFQPPFFAQACQLGANCPSRPNLVILRESCSLSWATCSWLAKRFKTRLDCPKTRALP